MSCSTTLFHRPPRRLGSAIRPTVFSSLEVEVEGARARVVAADGMAVYTLGEGDTEEEALRMATSRLEHALTVLRERLDEVVLPTVRCVRDADGTILGRNGAQRASLRQRTSAGYDLTTSAEVTFRSRNAARQAFADHLLIDVSEVPT